MTDLQRKAEALKALGLEASMGLSRARECVWIAAPRNVNTTVTDDIPWVPGVDAPTLEVAVRSAVLKVAPLSLAEPYTGDHSEPNAHPVIIRLLDADREPVETEQWPHASTYTEAWINAAVALVDARLTPKEVEG